VCGLQVWHKPATRDAHVEIIGDWDNWKRPGMIASVREDGWVAAAVDAPVGEHAYAIIEDGVWLADKQVAMTTFHEGHEVALGIVDDCERPALHVEGVTGSADGHAVVRVSFLASRAGAAVDLSSVVATSREGVVLPVSAVEAETGALRLETTGLKRGKYTFSIRARDTRGAQTDEAMATVWIEPHAFDPRDAIVYQVVLDRFRGDAGPLTTPARPSDRAGGTLAGLRKALEAGEIEALGVNTLWLSPLYQNPEGDYAGVDGRMYTSYHGYWPTAHRVLDSRVTSEEELERFMAAAHERGIRVLFDVVPNHVHEQHAWVKEHPDWFKEGCLCGQGSCDWATNIKTCWFTPYLPDLDWTNLDAHADRAERLCDALDQWRRWANGLHLPNEQLRNVIAVLEDDQTLNGTNQLAEAAWHWAHEAGVDLPQPQSQRPDRSIELGIDL